MVLQEKEEESQKKTVPEALTPQMLAKPAVVLNLVGPPDVDNSFFK